MNSSIMSSSGRDRQSFRSSRYAHWLVVTIDSVTHVVTKGTTPTTYGMPFTDEGVNFIKAEAVNGDSALDRRGFRYIDHETHTRLSRSILQKNDVLVTIAGANVGRCGYVRSNDLPANTNQAVGIVRVNSQRANPRFVYYFFKLPSTRSLCLSIGGQAAQPNVNLANLKAFEVLLPSRSEQTRIADILSAYDDLIENNRRRIALLEQAARELYREWFVRLRFPGHENSRIVDGLPAGWGRVRLSDVVSTQYGYTASASEEPIGPRFLRGKDINKNSYIDWDTVPYCPTSDLNFGKYALRTGDLLVVRMADPGKVAIVEKKIQAIFASYLVRLVIHDESRAFPLYLFYVLTDSKYQGFIGAASGGSTRKSASAKLLNDFGVIQPPNAIQSLFVDHVAPLRKMIGALLDQNAQARASREILLPRLMSGEVAA